GAGGAEATHDAGVGVTVGVADADGDDGDGRAHGRQQLRTAGGARAVVRDLEHGRLQRRAGGQQRALPGSLDVGGQEHGDTAELEAQHARRIVAPRRGSGQRCEHRATEGEGTPLEASVPGLVHAEQLAHRCHPAGVIDVRVSHDDGGQATATGPGAARWTTAPGTAAASVTVQRRSSRTGHTAEKSQPATIVLNAATATAKRPRIVASPASGTTARLARTPMVET